MNAQIARLRDIHQLSSAAQCEEYAELIGQLARAEPLDPTLLPDLFLSFFDDTDTQEVMWGLLHHVEDYPSPVYVPTLLDALPRMMPQARDWGLLLLRRVLNSKNDRPLLREAYHALQPPQQGLVREALRAVAAEDPGAGPVVYEVTHS